MNTPLKDQYEETGYVLIPSAFSPEEISRWGEESDALIQAALAQPGRAKLSSRAHLSQGAVYDRIDMSLTESPLFRALSLDPRIVDVAAVLFGEPATLAKDKLITKPPGTHGYLPHQDYLYWDYFGLPADHLVSALVAIDAADEENGALEVFPGLHRERLPTLADAPLDTDPATLVGNDFQRIDMQPGDVLFFHSMTPHQSGINRSGRSRRTLFLTYAPARYPRIYERFQHEKRPRLTAAD